MAGLIDAIINPAQADVIGAQQRGQQRADRDLAGEILGQTMTGKFGDLARSNPEMAQNLAKSMGMPTTSKGRIDNFMGVVVAAQKFVDAGIPTPQIAEFIRGEGLKVQSVLQATGEAGDGSRMIGFADKMDAGDTSWQRELKTMATAFAPAEEQTAGQKDRAALLSDLDSDDPRVKKSAEVALGLRGKAIGSAIQTIAEKGTAEVIAETEKTITEGKETGRQTAQLKFKPLIAEAVTLATKAAAARGETMTDLIRSEAALPGLLDSVGQLKDLASVATSTLGGKAFDSIVKESGFGSTKGANARVKFISIINNQILPLLRQTFGSAFTEKEGESLKATMSDPDASPSQKVLQLESFIDQKVRNIQASQRELGKEVTPAADLVDPQTPAAQPKFLGFE